MVSSSVKFLIARFVFNSQKWLRRNQRARVAA
jgi:hypothetical protein